MANKFARSNGNFDGPIWALTSSGVAGSTTTPTIGDVALANNFTVSITGSVACDVLTNAHVDYKLFNGAGINVSTLGNAGVFIADARSASVTIRGYMVPSYAGTNRTNAHCVSAIGTNSINIIGNIRGGSMGSSYGFFNASTGTVSITGSMQAEPVGNGGGHAFVNNTSSPVFIYGNSNGAAFGQYGIVSSSISTGPITVTGNITNNGFLNNGSANITAYGNVAGGADGGGVANSSTGPVTVYGNLNGSTASALSNTSTGSVTVLGNITADSRGFNGITSSNAAANVRISGNLIGAPNGIPAVYAASYTVNPVPYQTYIRYANNGTGVGSDAYLYHYTTDSLSAFSMPPLSAVRAGLQYANNTLTGTCQIPATSAVTFGALVDNTSGTAAITNNTLFDVSVASLTATDSLGARLKNSATVESVGRIIASFSN